MANELKKAKAALRAAEMDLAGIDAIAAYVGGNHPLSGRTPQDRGKARGTAAAKVEKLRTAVAAIE